MGDMQSLCLAGTQLKNLQPLAKPKAKTRVAKAKPKPAAKAGAGSAGADGGRVKGGKSKDAELEELEVKRRALMLGNKWMERISLLNQEVSIALESSLEFEDTVE